MASLLLYYFYLLFTSAAINIIPIWCDVMRVYVIALHAADLLWFEKSISPSLSDTAKSATSNGTMFLALVTWVQQAPKLFNHDRCRIWNLTDNKPI